MKITKSAFDRLVQQAIEGIPEDFRRHLDNMIITVRRRPSPEILADLDMPPGEDLLGFYQGVPLPERSRFDPPLYPDTIFLFQDPIENLCNSIEEIEAEIRITLLHEIAHFLGIDENRLTELGYD
jgi:predicted Zn-dependent protease with MMP-like domain